MDKIGLDGVAEELGKRRLCKGDSIDKYLDLYKEVTPDLDGVRYLKEKLAGVLDPKTAEDTGNYHCERRCSAKPQISRLYLILLWCAACPITPVLIFEISIDGFGGSVGGGGRYDEMIGRFTGRTQTCACGFSVGFERIVMLLLERDYQVPKKGRKMAFLLEKGISRENMLNAFKEAETLEKRRLPGQHEHDEEK